VLMGTSSNFGNMFSMAGAAIFLPFLPMLPVQILLNNLLYDLSELPIPLDSVDADALVRPRRWDMDFIRDFMLIIGPLSSIFDFTTFALLLFVFKASESLFQTGWFLESLASQVFVIFVIRTRGRPWASAPNPLLIAASLSVVALAVLLPFTPLGAWFGMVAPPVSLLIALSGVTLAYLMLVEIVKKWFYARHAASP
jgi:P-type Mg2+ transporter